MADNTVSQEVLALNEQWRPLSDAEVEMYNVAAPEAAALAVQKTAPSTGVATFTDVVAGTTDDPLTVAYRLRVTRSSTDKANGVTRLFLIGAAAGAAHDQVTGDGEGTITWDGAP